MALIGTSSKALPTYRVYTNYHVDYNIISIGLLIYNCGCFPQYG